MFLKRLAAVLLVAALSIALLSSCAGGGNKDQKGAGPAGKGGQEEPAGNGDEDKTTMTVYWIRDNNGPEAVPVTRQVSLADSDPAVMAAKALELLQAGPTEAEKKQGLSNTIPDAELLHLTVQRPQVILDFSAEFAQFGGTYRASAVIKQLTMTMSAIPGIKSVVLMVDGQPVGTEENPFTGEGLLFDDLTMDPAAGEAAHLGPADTLDLFIAVIPDVEKMWALMGPNARDIYKEPGSIEYSAFSEGLGSWRNYEVTRESIEGDVALVTIKGDQELEGQKQPDATYNAYMVRENGQWKWDFPPAD